MMYDIELIGGITGSLWWPQVQGALPIRVDFQRERARMDSPTLRDVADHILMEHGGDFQSATFTADTVLVITSRTMGRTRSRAWEITAFPSVADMVNVDVYSYDFNDSED